MTRARRGDTDETASTAALRHELLNQLAAAASLASVAMHAQEPERSDALERMPVELAIAAVLAEEVLEPPTVRDQHPVPTDVASALRAAGARFGKVIDVSGKPVDVVADSDALEHAVARIVAFGLALGHDGVTATTFERLETAGIEIRFPAPDWLASDPETAFAPYAGSAGHRPGLAGIRSWVESGGGATTSKMDGDDLVLSIELPRASA